MTNSYINIGNLKVSQNLANFVNTELLNGTNLTPEKFWEGFDKVVHELAPKNKELIDIRKDLQNKINNYFKFRC